MASETALRAADLWLAAEALFTAPMTFSSNPALKPIGPHGTMLWPFDGGTRGLSIDVQHAGAPAVFARIRYAYLQVCGSPCVGNTLFPRRAPTWTVIYTKALAI